MKGGGSEGFVALKVQRQCPLFLLVKVGWYVDRRIILRWIFRKLEGVVGTGWSWLKIGKGGGHLWVRQGTFGFHKCGEFLD